MGIWIGPQSSDQSSNWKELRTLLEFFRREARRPDSHYRNRRVFYFMDNSVTYDTCRKGKSSTKKLHQMVREIKGLSSTMNCLLIVVHIPGVEIIQQGSDALSRGMWSYGGYKQVSWDLGDLLKLVKAEKSFGL